MYLCIFNLKFDYDITFKFPHILEGIMWKMNRWSMDGNRHAQMSGWTEEQMRGWIYKERDKMLTTHKTVKNIKQHIKKYKSI